MMDITTGDRLDEGDVVGLRCGPQLTFTALGQRVAEALGEHFIPFLESEEFSAKPGEVAVYPGHQAGFTSAVVLGVGSDPDLDTIRKAGGALGRKTAKAATVCTDLADDPSSTGAVIEGFMLGQYRFDRYKSDAEPSATGTLHLAGGDAGSVEAAVTRADATMLGRDLINTPAIDQSPVNLAMLARSIADEVGLRTVEHDEEALFEGGFGGILGVAAGSSRPPRMVELWWEPEGAERFVALVGKGITFDSGGLSLKPAAAMETMKTDMSGAAVVIAVMDAVATLDLPIKVVGIIPLTDNLPGGLATKPGDVLKIRNGKTIEVLNTDAEGRLILADGLSLASELQPDAIIDVATLTGAAKVALGEKIGAVFGDDELAAQLIEAGEVAGERFWQLPLPSDYRKLIDSPIADMKNTGGRWGGASTAALLLAEFVDDIAWIHLDIAGPARCTDDDTYHTKGGSGFGARTLIELLSQLSSDR